MKVVFEEVEDKKRRDPEGKNQDTGCRELGITGAAYNNMTYADHGNGPHRSSRPHRTTPEPHHTLKTPPFFI